MEILNKLLEKIEQMLNRIPVEGYDNVKRMGAVMDAIKDVRKVIAEIAKAQEEGKDDEDHNEQGA